MQVCILRGQVSERLPTLGICSPIDWGMYDILCSFECICFVAVSFAYSISVSVLIHVTVLQLDH